MEKILAEGKENKNPEYVCNICKNGIQHNHIKDNKIMFDKINKLTVKCS